MVFVVRTLTISVVFLIFAPPVVHAEAASISTRDLPVHGARSLSSAPAPTRFDLVGLHWQGSGAVVFRTRATNGGWSQWQSADADTRPDSGSAESLAGRGWRLGNPVWTGPSDRLEYRIRGVVRRLRAYYVWSPVEHHALRSLSVAGSPSIIPRAAWGGDELPRRSTPQYASSVRLVIVHHTATPSVYSSDQAAAIVRGIDVYHVKGNGWNDIGYNFLVDRFGHVFEGRYGGVTRNVIGAHALGFNTGSVGIALIGNYMTDRPTPAQLQALDRLIGWRLDLAHVDPTSTLTYVSNGSERYRAGTRVTLRAVSGHRDTGFTSCPGSNLYSLLRQVARDARSSGLPKLFSPVVRGKVGGQVSFTARLSSSLAWTVTVTSPGGETVASGSGLGSTVSWIWPSAGTPPGRYLWTIEAGSSILPARGVIGGGSLPVPGGHLLKGLMVTPTTLSPNGDGYTDTATISYALTAQATVTATVIDSTGIAVATIVSAKRQSARAISTVWSPDLLPDGPYTLSVSASAADGRTDSATASFVVDRVLSSVIATPSAVSPDGDGIDDTAAFTFTLVTSGDVTITVVGPYGAATAVVFAGPLGPGDYSFGWNGTGGDGLPAVPGNYQVVVSVVDLFGTVTQPAAFAVAAPSV